MAEIYKILGQAAPALNTQTVLYTVPESTSTVVSTVVITNRSSSTATYRIAAIPSSETLSNKHYIAYDISLAANDSTNLSVGLSLAAGDSVSVYASSSDLTFGMFGVEIV